ncbi:AraC family transcriptional regulator [Anaerocolumna sedimenticola]|uniref:AraC family transcriptional regulator n=1 Tax=Anaerocolumna sedimenticola TaxID=2696063 RepID=A0A6P1TPI9_9FIRM|nr:AraC family transcriptional regulator [Anaerocolumna sedimenticola]QHQ61545.1 AraC family transcriptional regulator [Anaerocolumna sedimenticola]
MLAYYDTGETLFCDSDIFINKCITKETLLHAHSYIEIAFISAGNGIHKIGNDDLICKKGEVYIINHDIPHQFIADENCELEIYNCIFKPMFLDYSIIDSKKFYNITHSFLLKILDGDVTFKTPKIALLPKDFTYTQTLYEDMLIEYTIKDEGYIEVFKADLIKLIILILRTIKKETIINNNVYIKNDLLEKAIDYIHCNYYKDITIEELSMMAFLSQSHFCRLFKEYSGMTVKEFTQKIRIKEACILLDKSNKKIADIAAEVGYNDIKYFLSLFKKQVGMTPTEYKKQNDTTLYNRLPLN